MFFLYIFFVAKCAYRACGVFFSRGQGKYLSVIMEDFYSSWEKLSLFKKENTGFVLPNIPKRNEFIIATKFLIT